MKKALLAVALCLSVFAVFGFASCAKPNDSRLVGDWALTGSTIVIYRFTADEFITAPAGPVTLTYQYKANDGTGQYWIEGASAAKVDFTYEFGSTDDTMTLTLAGVAGANLTRVE